MKTPIKVFGFFVALASIIVMIRNFYILIFIGPFWMVPDYLNSIELVMAVIGVPALAYSVWGKSG